MFRNGITGFKPEESDGVGLNMSSKKGYFGEGILAEINDIAERMDNGVRKQCRVKLQTRNDLKMNSLRTML